MKASHARLNLFLFLFLLPSHAVAGDSLPNLPSARVLPQATPPANPESNARAERARKALEDSQRVMDAHREALAKAFEGKQKEKLTPQERNAIARSVPLPDREPMRAEFEALLTENTTDDAALDAILWLIDYWKAMPAKGKEQQDRLIALLDAHHLASTKILGLIRRNALSSQVRLRRILEVNQDPEVLGATRVALARYLLDNAELAGQLRVATPQHREGLEQLYPKQELELFLKLEPSQMEKEALILLERAEADLPESSASGREARSMLTALRKFQPGMPAPELEGPDLDGVNFKLSDYRGKVVLLEFGGHW